VDKYLCLQRDRHWWGAADRCRVCQCIKGSSGQCRWPQTSVWHWQPEGHLLTGSNHTHTHIHTHMDTNLKAQQELLWTSKCKRKKIYIALTKHTHIEDIKYLRYKDMWYFYCSMLCWRGRETIRLSRSDYFYSSISLVSLRTVQVCMSLYVWLCAYMFVCISVTRYCHVVNCKCRSVSVPRHSNQRSVTSQLWCLTCVSIQTLDVHTQRRWLRGHCVTLTSLLSQQKLPNNRHSNHNHYQ